MELPNLLLIMGLSTGRRSPLENRSSTLSHTGTHDAYEDMVSVWCADDRKQALDKVFKNDFIRNMKCSNPIKDNYNLASDLNVNGTPMIFIEDGTVIPGYVSSKKIIDVLAQLNKSK